MNRRVGWALRLYPAAWRQRYGAEFAALLEDVGPGWREWWDVARGGLKMRLKWNFATVTVSCVLLGAAVAGGLALRAPNQYVSTSVVKVDRPDGMTDAQMAEALQRAQTEVLSRTSIAEIIQREDVYRDDRKRMPMEDVVQQMRNRDIRVMPLKDAQNSALTAFAVSFAYPDRAKAQRVTTLLVAAFVQRLPRAGSFLQVQVLDPATLPTMPSSPNRLAYMVVGMAVGLAAGLLLLGIRRWPIVAVAGVGAGLVACAGSFLISDVYVSTAVLRMPVESAKEVLTDERLLSLIQAPRLDLYPKERAQMPIAKVIERMRADLAIQTVTDMQEPATAISFRYGDRYKAQAAVRFVVTALLEAKRPVVLHPAVLPQQPLRPNRLEIAALGLFAGLIFGAIVTASRRRPKAMTARIA
jgi:capsular polysaccharide biosynthesis protein